MKTKREIFMYSLLEFKEIEKRLEKRAAEGWRLKSAGTFYWTYEKAEPKQVHYCMVKMERGGCAFADSDLCNDIAVYLQQKIKTTFVSFGIKRCAHGWQNSFSVK